MPSAISDDIEVLRAHHDISAFTCGKSALDAWLRTRALRNQETGDSRTFVASAGGRVVGFYALTAAAAARVSLPGNLRRNAPDPVSLMLLGQLAGATSHSGRGLGRRLLRDALLRVANVSQHTGFRALAAHPLDDNAVTFFQKFGFTLVPDTQPQLMALPLHRLLAALEVSRR
jgi:predicted N-acetyltransferase YhbS